MNNKTHQGMLQKSNPSIRILIVLILALAGFSTVSSSAWALDGYQDRRGLLGGLMLGGGAVFTPADTSGLLGVGAHFGGGATEWLTLAVVMDLYWLPALEHDALVVRPGVQFRGFFTGGLFGELNTSMLWMVQEGDDELGLAAGVGVGYEFFVGANQAFWLSLGYERHVLFDSDDGNAVLVRLGSTWY